MVQNPKIYRINKQHHLLENLLDTNLIIETILRTSLTRLGFENQFNFQTDITQTEVDDFTYYLYTFNTDQRVSDWKQFLPDTLTENRSLSIRNISLILFVEMEFDILVLIGGNAYKLIVPFIDHSFGLNLYSRLMKPEEDEIASIRSRGLTGSRAGISEQFRDQFKIIDFIKFGKIPQEIHLKISQDATDTYFGFLKSKDDDRLLIYVGKSFKIKKKVDFQTLHSILVEISTILELEPSDYLSSYREINDQNFISNTLYPVLISNLYDDVDYVRRGQLLSANRFQFDFCNPNSISQFYEADEYRLKEKTDNGGYSTFDVVDNREEIYVRVLRRAVENSVDGDRFPFMVYLQGVRITCYKDGIRTISSSFIFHITSEFMISNQPYFLVDTKWYLLRDSFVEDLKINSTQVLNAYNAPDHILKFAWDRDQVSSEGEYNMLYDDESEYIVVDTIIVDGIELCDVMYYDDNTLFLAHIKYGFTSKMRELTNQILISSRRLREDLASENKSFVKEVFNKLTEKERNFNSLTEDQFVNLFNKNITYVLGFTSQLASDILVRDNIDSFNSNIARYSIVQCSSEMRASNGNLLLFQIPRSNQ